MTKNHQSSFSRLIKKRLSEPSTKIGLATASIALISSFGVITHEQAIALAGILNLFLTGIPDKQHLPE